MLFSWSKLTALFLYFFNLSTMDDFKYSIWRGKCESQKQVNIIYNFNLYYKYIMYIHNQFVFGNTKVQFLAIKSAITSTPFST